MVVVFIVRFWIIGSARTSGWRVRLQRPEKSAVEANWNIRLPGSIETYFRSEIPSRSEFYLAPPGSEKSEWWYIERFIPLTCRDLIDWISVTNVPGIPIAIDGSKGTYYIPFEPSRQISLCPVLLRLPGHKREDRKVASTFDEFANFEPRD